MKSQTIYSCSECDAQSPKWTGQCLECGAWGSMGAGPAAKRSPAGNVPAAAAAKVTAFDDLASEREHRIPTGIAEADRVFGGGIVPGSITLLGGEPGIGKSTLAMVIASKLASGGRKTLYVSGEESASQVKMRADRLALSQKGLYFLNETDVPTLLATLAAEKPAFAVIDSVQMLRSDDVPAEAGAVGQVRAAAARVVAFAKSSGIPVLLIGHVTKDGMVAGPKTLEHLVDSVLSFEGERTHPLRTLRALKNRFGSTDETGIFEMRDDGLAEIKNPSAYLLEARQEGVPGSAISCVMEGTRPVLIEVQALVQKSPFGYPARKSSGIDQSRVDMLLAVLARRAGLDFGQHDVFVNVVGGLKIKEPAADLAVALALASALRHAPLPPRFAAWGEIGLGGEVRPAPGHDRRAAEAASLGIARATAPLPRSAGKKTPAIVIIDVRNVKDAVAAAQAPAVQAPRPA
ncbi:MAG TPA: DNA repair protein RadA [Candidatus Eisenbacteria bacterium]|nr:DNA repair protein RadA [Candidatus Eisenbacteria bacterium]